MGAWSVSVTGNDMARDLKMDYSCAFYRWGESAADKIDEYIRTRFDETDPDRHCTAAGVSGGSSVHRHRC